MSLYLVSHIQCNRHVRSWAIFQTWSLFLFLNSFAPKEHHLSFQYRTTRYDCPLPHCLIHSFICLFVNTIHCFFIMYLQQAALLRYSVQQSLTHRMATSLSEVSTTRVDTEESHPITTSSSTRTSPSNRDQVNPPPTTKDP
jgi:hypothetical protein